VTPPGCQENQKKLFLSVLQGPEAVEVVARPQPPQGPGAGGNPHAPSWRPRPKAWQHGRRARPGGGGGARVTWLGRGLSLPAARSAAAAAAAAAAASHS
jgi:hypothetical protein